MAEVTQGCGGAAHASLDLPSFGLTHLIVGDLGFRALVENCGMVDRVSVSAVRDVEVTIQGAIHHELRAAFFRRRP